ncbi:MAG: hypothetical protein HYS80_00125 [Candidatus Aenigmarchaeota archaeon]|nr:hypothetical protein [Candidatus Aenigmarchaeota archaeon]
MGWKKKLLIGSVSIVFVLVALGVLFGGSETESSKTTGQVTGVSEQQSLTMKSASEMLPTREEIPTEFVMSTVNDISTSVSVSGLEEAKSISTDKIEGSFGVISVGYSVYKFSTVEDAIVYHNGLVDNVVQVGGYEEIKLSSDNCFSYKEDYGFEAKMGQGICVEKNVVFTVGFASSNSFKSPDGFIKDGIKLLDKKVS